MPSYLEKSINSLEIRDVFNDGYQTILNHLQKSNFGKYLVHAFCGIGKSRLMYKSALVSISYNNNLNLFVFPSIALITQFNKDYIFNDIEHEIFSLLSICSKNELTSSDNTDKKNFKKLKYTTSEKDIIKFINKNTPKLICCTYQSLSTFITCCLDTNITVDFVCFDEAHRTESDTITEDIYSNNTFYNIGLFLTATPSEYMKNNLERIIYVPYYVGLQKKYLKPFELRLDIDNKQDSIDACNHSIYKSIARAILQTENNRVMTFHRYSNPNHDNIKTNDYSDTDSNIIRRSDVITFTNQKLFKKAFNEIIKSEFPQLNNKYKKITLHSITADTKKRNTILENFELTPDNEITILCSCRTIGEGIDTKKANMCVFVDPKQSYKNIIQNIGRVLRVVENDNKIATILIPTLIDYQPYREAKTNEDKDKILRENLNNNNDYNGIMNVISALNQDNEEYFNLCLNYSKKYDPEKIKKTIRNEGKKQICEGNLKDVLSNINIKIKNKYKNNLESNMLEIAKNNHINIQIRTTDIDNPVIEYNTDNNKKTITLMKDDNNIYRGYVNKSIDDLDNDIEDDGICTIMCKCSKCDKNTIEEEKQKKREFLKKLINMNVHTNDEFTVLWNIKEDNFNKSINSAVIDCTILTNIDNVDKWNNKLVQVKEYI